MQRVLRLLLGAEGLNITQISRIELFFPFWKFMTTEQIERIFVYFVRMHIWMHILFLAWCFVHKSK